MVSRMLSPFLIVELTAFIYLRSFHLIILGKFKDDRDIQPKSSLLPSLKKFPATLFVSAEAHFPPCTTQLQIRLFK